MQWLCTRASSATSSSSRRTSCYSLSVIVVAWVQCLNIIKSMLHVICQHNIYCTYRKIKSLIGYFWIKCALVAICCWCTLHCSNALNMGARVPVHSTRKVHSEQFQCQWAILSFFLAHFAEQKNTMPNNLRHFQTVTYVHLCIVMHSV